MGVICVHIVSMDIEQEPGERSAVSVTFTGIGAEGAELYLSAEVEDFGQHRVNDEADTLFSEIDQESEFLRK